MDLPKEDIVAVLRQFNPWWDGSPVADLPAWRRAAYRPIMEWIDHPPAHRALLLSGARQTGKTTLFLQVIDRLLSRQTPAANILYVTFDHPVLKLAGLEKTLAIWREYVAKKEGPDYLFLDEIQNARDWPTWLKLQVDFKKNRRIAVTGSATPLNREGLESGVGRWQTLRLATLSFCEFTQLRKEVVPDLPTVQRLSQLAEYSPRDLVRVAKAAQPMTLLFHEYLVRGGFPQCALVDSVTMAQRLLREDIVDKVLKRDMTALYGVRRIVELEQLFLYFCLHDGDILSMPELCANLELKKPTAMSFIDILEASHLIYRLMPFGYGKEVLRGRAKIHLTDPAIAPSVFLKGRSILEDAAAMGHVVESAFVKHVIARYYQRILSFSYWRDRQGREIDIIADAGDRLVPFEVKYRSKASTKGGAAHLAHFCADRKVDMGYLITKDLQDIGIDEINMSGRTVRILRVPAALACYWLGQTELAENDSGTADM